MSQRSEFLCQFSRHTPRILRRQLILQLAEQYLSGEKNEDLRIGEVRPSIQRFHGALLFIDISGFTALSQRLSVEDLKNHINDYFTKMLDIVDKHEGDVVKFAGDALFIVWESCTSVAGETAKHKSEELNRIAVEKAVECGREINRTCCDHKIVLNQNKAARRISHNTESTSPLPSPSSFTSSQMLMNFHTGSSKDLNAITPDSNQEEFAYLNVHSGVSVGLMAGIDIGADNRWEYFLVGEPLGKVAEAESQASSGDMIMCPESHALLHPSDAFSSSGKKGHQRSLSNIVSHFRMKFQGNSMNNLHAEQSAELPCGCTTMTNGYCKVKITPNAWKTVRKAVRRRRGSVEEAVAYSDMINVDLHDVVKAFDVSFKKVYTKHTQTSRLMKPGGTNGHGTLSEEVMHQAFYEWAEACLTDDIARHVHHVMRSEYVFADVSRQGACERDFEEAWATHTTTQQQSLPNPTGSDGGDITSNQVDSEAQQPITRSPNGKPILRPINTSPCLITNKSSPLLRSGTSSPALFSQPADGSTPLVTRPNSRQFESDNESGNESSGSAAEPRENVSSAASTPRLARHQSFSNKKKKDGLLRTALLSPINIGNTTSSLSAELRNVTVLFIKIQMSDTELLIDSTKRSKVGGSYRFLGTTLNERVADQRLLNRFQKCIEVLSGALTSYGGQMRQFIVDDKGTVCIGTFGLRGSVSDDNAAAALDAAHTIVVQMQVLGLQCSIGVTVGKTYCGLVGSSNRHEYAVMGPSVNLSARLMGKAPACGVICDSETRKRDRNHDFVDLEDIVAKGYSAPVGTFKPVFPEVEAMLSCQSQDEQSVPHHPSGIDEVNNSSHQVNNKLILKMIAAANHRTKKLQGRSEEMSRAITFAFHGIVSDCVNVASLVPEVDKPALPAVFDTGSPARLVGIFATDGMGKSHLASSVAERVYSVSKHTPGSNIQMFKSRFDSFNSDVPFKAWKPIIIEIISRIYRTNKAPTVPKAGEGDSNSELDFGVAFVMTMLPEFQRLQPLFGFLSIGSVRQDALKALQLTSQDKINYSIQLLLAVIELYSCTSKNLIFITMEDVHSFDKASLRLLHEVHASSTGVIVLFTGRTTKHSGIRTDSVDPGNILHDFIAPIKRSARFLELELAGLSKAATIELIKSAMHSMDVGELDNNFYDRVFEVSGGNPLYAYEIARSFAHGENSVATGKITLSHNARTEEVICYRFDQLKTSAQALLKMAAVICANKSTFSLTMLSRMDDWDLLEGCECFTYPVLSEAEEAYWSSEESFSMEKVYSATRVKYAKILFNILKFESFIRLATEHGSHKEAEMLDDSSVEMLLISTSSFEFTIPLEQSTIYNLLLDDQKHALHEGVAEYFSRSRTIDGTENDLEEGFHWHKASVWNKSMMCYNKAFEAEVDSVTRSEHLDLAYQAFQGMASRGDINHLGISFTSLKNLFEDTMSGGERKSDLIEDPIVTLQKAYEVFSGDSQLLSVGLMVLVRVASQRKHRFENFIDTQRILEDAIQIALQTKNAFLMSSSYLNLLTTARLDARVDGEELNLDDMHFYLHNFWPTFFRIMSSYCMNYVMSTVLASDYSRKASFIAEQFLVHACTEGKQIDVIQALNVNVLVQNKLSNLKVALKFNEELRVLYVFETHSSLLVDLYGADHLIYMLTRTIKYVILTGEMEKANGFITYALHWFYSLTHVASLTLSVLRLVSVLAYINRFDEALGLLTRYEIVVFSQNLNASECIPPKLIGLYREWLQRHINYLTDMEGTETKEVNELIEQIEVLVSTKDKHALESNSLLLYHKQDVMIVLADLYALKAKKDAHNESELTNDSLVCCMYLQSVMSSQIVDTHDVFSKARAVHIVLRILKALACLQIHKESEYHNKFRKVFTVAALSDLRTETQINQLHALSEEVTNLNQQLHSDV